jgi:hypothetical protein
MKFVPAVAAIITVISPIALGDTLRCGSALINQGDRAFEVLRKCGKPAHKDLIGYTVGGYDRREAIREEWVYGPRNGGTYVLTFEANRLVNIEFMRD